PTVSLIDPGANLHFTVNLTADASDAGSGIASTDFEYSAQGSGTWVGTPAAWDTTLITDGLYDLRVTAKDNAGNSASDGIAGRRVDNTLPTASLADPGRALRGAVSLSSTSDDSGSGVASVQYQYTPAGTTVWTNTPASWDTTVLADGFYDLRVVVTDAAGNAKISDAVLGVLVDNTPPSVTMDSPGTAVSGTVALSSSASDPGGSNASGVTGVAYQYSLQGSGVWTDTPAAWDTTPLSDGLYELRATATDGSGNKTTSTNATTTSVDNTRPQVSITSPSAGSWVNGSASDPFTIAASASDGSGTVASVEFFACSDTSAGCATGTWTSLGTDSTGPYTGSWPLPSDGDRALRAVATDTAGGKSSAVVDVKVDRTAATAALDSPGTNLRGTVALTASASDATSGVDTVAFQRSLAGADTWTTIATDSAAPYATDFVTTSVDDGVYDLRIVATDKAGNEKRSTLTNRRVDNTAPEATMTSPGASVSGTVTLSSTQTDAGSGVATVTYRYAAAGSGAWTTTTVEWNTLPLADGPYDLHVVVTDNAGNTTTSASVTTRVDNVAPSTSHGDLPAYLRGNVTLTAEANDAASGIDSVAFQRATAGSGTWVTIGTDSTQPYSLDLDTTTVTDGLYDFRSEATDGAGNRTASAAITGRRIDNTKPTATMGDPGANVRGTVTLSS
ncbi:MAG: Ig-like domain-containing protein, partial [Actinomycetota bacterium]|nr:Ig-like domain-containing protein [Actinomycetota bacterium]